MGIQKAESKRLNRLGHSLILCGVSALPDHPNLPYSKGFALQFVQLSALARGLQQQRKSTFSNRYLDRLPAEDSEETPADETRRTAPSRGAMGVNGRRHIL